MLYLPYTLAQLSHHQLSVITFGSSASRNGSRLLVASTTHRQSYKQQIKATKNSRARPLKQRAKRELAATIERTQETPIMELSLKRND